MGELLDEVLDVYAQRPRSVLLMSGGGSNAEAILKEEALRDLYDFRLIVTDKSDSNAPAIAAAHGLGVLVRPAGRFAGDAERWAYFDAIGAELGRAGIEAAIYAGFMKITPPDFCLAFPGVNIHPADLTIADPADGMARYRGMGAMARMRADLGFVASTLHVVDTPVDAGSSIAVSSPVDCPPELSDAACHEALKLHEHRLFPAGLIALAQGGLQRADLPLRLDTAAGWD